MIIHLPEDLEHFLHAQVQNGRYASEAEAITEAVRLLKRCEPKAPEQASPLSEEELERRLIESGFLASVPPRASGAAQRDFEPIKIEGEPLSETVIRERR